MNDADLFGAAADSHAVGPPDDIEQLPDGVYLNLEPRIYFGQWARLHGDGPLVPRVGGSDLITLAKRREGYWWSSPLNSLRDRGSTTAQNYGSALHSWLLEGERAYITAFMVEPNPADFPNVLRSESDIRKALEAEKVPLPAGYSKWKKEGWSDFALGALPGYTVWDEVRAAFTRTLESRPGRQSVTATEHAMLEIMINSIMEGATPEAREIALLLGADDDHPPMAEVSILYTDRNGIPRRARIDRMYPAFDLDLKSLRGDWQSRNLELAVDDVIKKGGYDIQRADYRIARRYAYAFISMGPEYIHGGTAEQRAWLATWPDRFPKWEWVWLFYQKPDMVAGAAPILFPLWDDHASAYHVRGLRKGVRALEAYQRFMETFGPHKPWARVEPLHYTNPDLIPGILTYPDNAPDGEHPVEDEDELLG